MKITAYYSNEEGHFVHKGFIIWELEVPPPRHFNE